MSKIKELREKNPEFVIDMVKLLSERDPSGTNKYLKFMIDTSKPFVESYFNTGQFLDVSFVQLTTLVKKFEQYAVENLLAEKDIYAYENVEAIEKAIKEADVIAELRNVKTTETLVLFEDANCILVKPLSPRSSVTYGKNTKWCTSENNGGSFNSFASEGCLLYFMWKHPPVDLPEEWRKVAFNRKSITDESRIWNAPDKQISGGDAWRLGTVIGQEIMGIITKEFDLCIPNTSLRKDASGKILIEKTLFDKDGFKKRRKEIEAYVATLKGNREKKLTKPETFEHTPEERKILDESAEIAENEAVEDANGLDVTEALHNKLMEAKRELKEKETLNKHLINSRFGEAKNAQPAVQPICDAKSKIIEEAAPEELQVKNFNGAFVAANDYAKAFSDLETALKIYADEGIKDAPNTTSVFAKFGAVLGLGKNKTINTDDGQDQAAG
jgi:hypothetical protein